METTSLHIDEIVVGERLRPLDRDAVERLKQSIAKIGIKTPLSVRFLSAEDGWSLVAGRHRLQAAIELGFAEVPVREETGGELDARMWEIAENLHRAELTVLGRSEHEAEWIRLAEERERVSAQLAPKLSSRGRSGEGRPSSGINAAARELGIDRTEAQRAVKIDALAPEVKVEAQILRLDDNQTALLKAARQPTKSEQLRALREHAARRADEDTESSGSERRIAAAVKSIKALSQEEMLIFAEWFDEYRAENGASVFDQTTAGRR